MVNAHLSQIQENGYIHAIFKTEQGNRVSAPAYLDPATAFKDAKKQMYFLNRNMMAKVLTSFLLQRKAAFKNSDIAEVATKLYRTIYENRLLDFHEFVKVVEFNYPGFLIIIPSEKSRFYKHYKEVIEPILYFCIGKEN